MAKHSLLYSSGRGAIVSPARQLASQHQTYGGARVQRWWRRAQCTDAGAQAIVVDRRIAANAGADATPGGSAGRKRIRQGIAFCSGRTPASSPAVLRHVGGISVKVNVISDGQGLSGFLGEFRGTQVRLCRAGALVFLPPARRARADLTTAPATTPLGLQAPPQWQPGRRERRFIRARTADANARPGQDRVRAPPLPIATFSAAAAAALDDDADRYDRSASPSPRASRKSRSSGSTAAARRCRARRP